MPLLDPSSYVAPFGLRNGHAQTILASLIRRVKLSGIKRERLELPDGDFIDLDWREMGLDRIAVIAHGLEGNSRRPYVQGLQRCLGEMGYDTVSWNCRGCSGEPNRLPRSYHSGASEDLDHVIAHVIKRQPKKDLLLAGFSLGGNLTLKYLGEDHHKKPPQLIGAAVISVPCDLADAADQLAKSENGFYMRRFIQSLVRKIREKAKNYPGLFSVENIHSIRTFHDFDNRYTAPIHGFEGVDDYYHKCSSRRYLQGVGIPTLILNAKDDPFLAGGCYPEAEALRNPQVFLEMPAHGGHVGFIRLGKRAHYGSDLAVAAFLKKNVH